MAWKNVTRYRQRFVITVISMFLGIEMFLIVMVIITGSDYANIINQRPDFLIAGEFSEFAKKEGSGTEYQTQSPDQDPMKSEGDNFELLYDNEYGEFSPISEKVRNRLWNLDGVKKKKSYITEGAYMLPVYPEMDYVHWKRILIWEKMWNMQKKAVLIMNPGQR